MLGLLTRHIVDIVLDNQPVALLVGLVLLHVGGGVRLGHGGDGVRVWKLKWIGVKCVRERYCRRNGDGQVFKN